MSFFYQKKCNNYKITKLNKKIYLYSKYFWGVLSKFLIDISTETAFLQIS